ncbi:hypothetical protein CROQUDRAFT_666046 [Cronartium quercuum f. sp. fusiforme G11]|uniref:Golgi to ER traffic protein 4 n=1 Tax=Cronartium quercuum f. sp. fusiforme G11 TaxID=708437 RepID=A0A9P6N975_9BASI|nr:hypothetical protein CROQUDRAFT_666046 [Cronartium quercuum f. sp. fusiforme G11]
MPTPSLARTLKSIQNLVDHEEWYAAHQKYRTSAARLLKSSEATASQDAISLLFEGSRLLLQRQQLGSGTDLALMLIRDVYVGRKIAYTPDERNKLLNLIALTGPADNWRKTIIDASLSWSSDAGQCPTGDPVLHLTVGELLAKENQLHLASVHLLSACNQDAARALSGVMWTWSKQETKPEAALGRYAARGVLGYLELGSILVARTFLEDFLAKVTKTYPKLRHSSLPCATKGAKDVEVYTSPALNFLQLLILTCQVGPGTLPSGAPAPNGHTGATVGKAVFQAMIGRYARVDSWIGSQATKETLDVLAQMYFGIKPLRPSGNILNDLMGSLFSGGGGPALPPSSSRGLQGRGKNTSSQISTPGLD